MAKQSRDKTQQGQQQPYDNLLKSLLEGQEQQMLPFLLEGVQYLRTLDVEVIRNPLRVDRAYLVYYEGEEHILHIEFESGSNNQMASRLLDYNAYLHHKYQYPVISIIVYPFQTKMAESPYIVSNKKRELNVFHFEVLPLWKQLAEQYLQEHAVMMYALLPTMQGANADLLHQAIDEMVEYYRENPAKLGEELRWLGILLRRANIVPLDEKRQIEERLSMFDELIENDPKMKKMLADREARGRVEGARSMVVKMVQGRFPTLVALARKRTARISKLDALDHLVKDFMDAPDEATARAILEASERRVSRSKQGK